MASIKVVRASVNDSEALVNLEKEYMEFHNGLDDYFSYKDNISEIWLPYLKSCLEDDDFIVLVAKDGSRVIGYGMAKIATKSPIYNIEKVATVLDLFVSSDYDRKAVSKMLLDECIKWAKKKGINHIEHPIAAEDNVREELSKDLGFEDHIITLKKRI